MPSYYEPIPIIKNLLTLKGVTLALFAFNIGIPMSQASYIANGLTVPQDAAKRKAIARFLEQPEEAIFPASMIKDKRRQPRASAAPDLSTITSNTNV